MPWIVILFTYIYNVKGSTRTIGELGIFTPGKQLIINDTEHSP